MDVIFNINKFDLTYKDVNKLSVLPVSAPFFTDGVMMFKALVSLNREGFEVNRVESRNVDIPVFITIAGNQYNTLEIFARCANKTASPTDIAIVNSIISQINPDIVIKSDNHIWEYVEPVVGEEPVPEPVEGGEDQGEGD